MRNRISETEKQAIETLRERIARREAFEARETEYREAKRAAAREARIRFARATRESFGY